MTRHDFTDLARACPTCRGVASVATFAGQAWATCSHCSTRWALPGTYRHADEADPETLAALRDPTIH